MTADKKLQNPSEWVSREEEYQPPPMPWDVEEELPDDPECDKLVEKTFNRIMSQGYFLTVAAGTGKSTFEKKTLKKAHDELQRSFQCMGPTHTSCRALTVADLKDKEGGTFDQEARTVVHIAKRKLGLKTWKVPRVKENMHVYDEWFNTQPLYALNFPMMTGGANSALRHHIIGDPLQLGPHQSEPGTTERYLNSYVLWKLAGGNTHATGSLCPALGATSNGA